MEAFLRRWVRNLLSYFGLYNKDGKLLILGLDNAGKTTLMRMLADDRAAQHAPTQRATSEQLTFGGIDFHCFDLGGHREAREVWADYYVDVAGIIFVVDAADRARFGEAKRELDSLLTDPRLTGVPLVVLGNKIDLAAAASEQELRSVLGMTQTTGRNTPMKNFHDGTRPLELFMCSVVGRSGHVDPIRWLAMYF